MKKYATAAIAFGISLVFIVTIGKELLGKVTFTEIALSILVAGAFGYVSVMILNSFRDADESPSRLIIAPIFVGAVLTITVAMMDASMPIAMIYLFGAIGAGSIRLFQIIRNTPYKLKVVHVAQPAEQ